MQRSTRSTRFTVAILGLLALFLLGLAPLRAETESYGCVLLIDGLRGDMARKYAAEGLMPNVKKHFLDKGLWVDKATSVFPSITGAAIPSCLTGAYPGRHKLPSLYFFERPEKKYYVLYTAKGATQFNDLLDTERTRTIFEHFPGKRDSMAVGLQVNRGADTKISVVWNVKYKPLTYRAKFTSALKKLRRAFLGGDPTRLTVFYNGWFDHMEHSLGVESEELKEHYQAVDWQVGQAFAHYEKLGILDKTYFVLLSDHGQLGFDKGVNIWSYIKDNFQVPIVENDWVKIPLLPIDWDVKNPDDYSKKVMVVPCGQAHGLLYFAAPVNGGNDWDRRPTFDELRHYPLNGKIVDVIEVARNTCATDFAVGKNYEDGKVYVFGHGDREATIERMSGPGNEQIYRYTVAPGHRDPLGYLENGSTQDMVNRDPEAGVGAMYFGDKEWQLATCGSAYPDGVTQLTQIFDTYRAPDLFINGQSGYNLIGDTYDGEVSRHGAINEWESWATFSICGPGLTAQHVDTARIVDMVPTLLHCMQVPYDPNMMDGRVLPAVRQTLMGPGEADPTALRLRTFAEQVARLEAAEKLARGLEKLGVGSNAEVARLLEAQRRCADLAALCDEQARGLVGDFRAEIAADPTVFESLCRTLRAEGPAGKARLAPLVKMLARALPGERAEALRACL